MTSRRARLAVGAWLLLLAAACASNPRAETPAAPPAPAVASLRAELDALFTTAAFEHALWAAKVQSMATGQVLYERNATKLVMPASNMKIVTMAAAAERLGWDHRFVTEIVATGPVEDGVLRGDLVVRGGGDPTIGTGERPEAVLDEWAAALAAGGLTTVDGRVIGDDDRFDDEAFGAAWSWDDVPYGYAAPIGALQFHQGLVVVQVEPGASVGDPARITISPAGSSLSVVNEVETVAAEVDRSIGLARLPTRSRLVVRGRVPLESEPYRRTAAVVNPTAFFARAFRAALERRGIVVQGPAVDIDDLHVDEVRPRPSSHAAPSTTSAVLLRHESPPLSEVGAVLMKDSQNLYAETLLKAMGASESAEGTARAGREAVRMTLAGWGIPESEIVMFDGSGLSRNNYLTADMLVKILRAMHRGPHFEAFLATMPVAGVDGTLERRMRSTRAEGNVRAKSGTISNVRALSGYVITADDELLAFSIVANHFRLPGLAVLDQIDLAAERLANFTRTR